ncbi:hypothetical protein [Bradyrhizobium sp.]|uniref:hypothetical protein n=1 Tax=Bradyrhizobium sp. TaxID=376 RepID=UPI00261CB5CB|nr:hypothetical protein [Bradyrhizobium sp.]
MPITDPAAARVLVYNIVVDWVGDAVNLAPDQVDVSRTFQGAPPAGYGFDEGRFLQMCDEIAPKLSLASGRVLKLPGNWRVQHENDAINTFIDAVALRLMASSMTPLGIKAHAFAMTHPGSQS